mgnify:CR=1 FL=1
MKTKFTKASRTDGTLVTVNLAQFDGEGENEHLDRKCLVVGSPVFMTVDGHEVTFRVNRMRNGVAATAVTHCFPRYLRLPQVGRPVSADVTEVY